MNNIHNHSNTKSIEDVDTDRIVTKNKNQLNTISKEDRKKNVADWFMDSKFILSSIVNA